MTIKPISVLSLLAMMPLAACSRGASLFTDVQATRSPQVTVVEADALVVDGRPVRLSNANAPQLAPQAHCWAEGLAARQVRETVQGLVAGAREVTVTPTGGTDEDSRIFSRVAVNGVDLGETLMKDGLAAAPGEARFDWCGPMSIDRIRYPRLSELTRAGG
ncbi:nuclease [Phenylobacterium sp.]|uniref:thermonuclease family protein n=1 Tax=Phenylobacterium sp. TaxID=1871053 RepID=UPI002E36793B|nr:nuclease [Phenylobacterium sp.]